MSVDSSVSRADVVVPAVAIVADDPAAAGLAWLPGYATDEAAVSMQTETTPPMPTTAPHGTTPPHTTTPPHSTTAPPGTTPPHVTTPPFSSTPPPP